MNKSLNIQSTLAISTSVISNNRLSRSEILVPVLTETKQQVKILWIRPEFFYFLVLGSADPKFWKSRIKIKLGSKSFIGLGLACQGQRP